MPIEDTLLEIPESEPSEPRVGFMLSPGLVLASLAVRVWANSILLAFGGLVGAQFHSIRLGLIVALALILGPRRHLDS